jgi:hypothetical protein
MFKLMDDTLHPAKDKSGFFTADDVSASSVSF